MGVTTQTQGVRAELSRLILDGLLGRSQGKLIRQLVGAFTKAGIEISAETCRKWIRGETFPANRQRQQLIGNVVGGPCGEAIKALAGPAFRGYRRRVMKETETMKGPQHGGAAVRARQFQHVSLVEGDGRRFQYARITCATCEDHLELKRGGSLEYSTLFSAKGWEVGKVAAHDYCPKCVAARKVVVKMSDHVKQPEVAAPEVVVPAVPVMSKEDGRIVSRLIDDHWDVASNRYQPGWSDAKMAAEIRRPVEWVKEIRERDYGSTGEDPMAEAFVAERASILAEVSAQAALMSELMTTASALPKEIERLRREREAMAHLVNEIERALRMIDKHKAAHGALLVRVRALGTLDPFKAAG